MPQIEGKEQSNQVNSVQIENKMSQDKNIIRSQIRNS